MPRSMRGLLGLALLVFAAAPAAAQASPYLPLDDPRLPLLEHLIARGDVEDPSPMVRPFRLADAERVLAAADTGAEGSETQVIRTLRAGLAEDTARARWEAELRVGGTAYTQKRRDQLHLGGPGTENPYLDFGLRGALGPIAYATRPAVDPRLIGDPDWPNQAQENLTGRLVEGYLSAQFKFGSLTYGQVERNWGPVGLPGIPLSNYGYQRQGLALTLGTGSIRLDAMASDLRSETDSIGEQVNRYLIVHRLGAQLSRRFRLALWESIIIAGPGRILETPFANPLSPSVLANTFGIQDLKSNVMIGADIHWRVRRPVTFEAQLALDDFLFNMREKGRDRWALAFSFFGPLGRDLSWRAMYTQVSSLALRTFNPMENFTDAGVGTGRNFSDQDQFWLTVAKPVARQMLVAPELVVQRQGEGKINDPYPVLVNGVLPTPALFIGTVETTYRAGLRVSGRFGPVDLSAVGGFHHVTNDQNRPGVTANRFVGQALVLWRWRWRGTFH